MKKSKSSNQVIFGRNPILEAIASGKEFERIHLKDSMHGEFEKKIRSLCREHMIPLKRVPQVRLDRLSNGKNNQGIVGFSSFIEYQKIENVIPFLFEKGINPVLVILDRLQDIRNIGAIARTCEVLGAHSLILSGKDSANINEDAVKTSAGALFRIPVCREPSTIQLINKLKEYGIRILGSSLSTKNLLQEISLLPPIAVIMGSESDGLHRDVESNCDDLIKIPQTGRSDSLNVSVAFGIILYEIQRQSSS